MAHHHIHTSAEALEVSEHLLTNTDDVDSPDGVLRSWAVLPLAAVLLTVAHANGGQVQLAAVRKAFWPASQATRSRGDRWALLATSCPDRHLADRLRAIARMNGRQRDSLVLTILDAVAG